MYKNSTDRRGTGWIKDLPSFADYTESHPKIAPMAKTLKTADASAVPEKVDNRKWDSSITNQGGWGSCTAHFAEGALRYYANRTYGKNIHLSRMFIYTMTKFLLGWEGDTGAYLRTTMGAITLFGAPQERFWKYKSENFDVRPEPAIFAMADNYEAVSYFRHDPGELYKYPECIHSSIKKYLAAGIPVGVGFYGFPSFGRGDFPGAVPAPGPGEAAGWGHAVLLLGYDDNMEITNKDTNVTTKGAYIFRNSWGKNWGDSGYGYLPYWYLDNRCMTDCWSLLAAEWVGTKQFGL